MKQLFSLIFFLCFTGLIAQTVTINPPSQTICPGGSASFNVLINPDTSSSYIFRWSRNGQPFAVEDSIHPILNLKNLTYADTGFYTVTVITPFDTLLSNSAFVHFKPALTIDTLYRYNQLGCPGTCKGQMKVHISGGNPPYDYYWGSGYSQDTIVTSLCQGKYLLTVYDSDSSHCISREYEVKVLTLPKIEFTTEPDTTVYLTNPFLTAAFPDTSLKYLSSWEWTIKEGIGEGVTENRADSTVYTQINPAKHTYKKPGTSLVKLHFTDVNGCDSTVLKTINVKVADLKFYDLITPDGKGSNENFVITIENVTDNTTLNDVYPSNTFIVLNRWGNTVYKKENYRCDGKSGDWDGNGLADGVYYYIFTGHGFYGDDVWKGSVTILRKK